MLSIYVFSSCISSTQELYNDYIVEIRSNVFGCSMTILVILVSTVVILNSIDHLSLMESMLSLVYIFLLLGSMIISTLSSDLIRI